MNSLEKSIINWCRLHPDNVDCQYLLKGIREVKIRKEAKKWKSIAAELLDVAKSQGIEMK